MLTIDKEVEKSMSDIEDVNESSESLKSILPRCAQIRRFKSPYGRSYAVLGGGYKVPMLCCGLTTWIDKCNDGRDESALDEFQRKLGGDYDRYMNELADFGTLGHIFTGRFFTQGKMLTGWSFEKEIYDYMIEKGMPLHKHQFYTDKMAMYLYSMGCFYKERNVEVFSIEYPVCDFEKGIATCIDLVCEMDDLDKQGRIRGRINATVNFKFRLNASSYEKDEVQSNIEMFILQNLLDSGLTRLPKENQNIHKTFILCPKNITSRTRDNYLLVDTTGKYSREQYYNAHEYRVNNGLLNVDLEREYPRYRNALLIAGQQPEYYTLRERMNEMFL